MPAKVIKKRKKIIKNEYLLLKDLKKRGIVKKANKENL